MFLRLLGYKRGVTLRRVILQRLRCTYINRYNTTNLFKYIGVPTWALVKIGPKDHFTHEPRAVTMRL